MENSRWVSISPALAAHSHRFGAVVIEGLRQDCLRLRSENSALRPESDELELSIASRDGLKLQGQFIQDEKGSWYFQTDVRDRGFIDLKHAIRKEQHINLCQFEDVEHAEIETGFSRVKFEPRAIPEFEIDDISTKQQLFGREFALPILITGMTGGIAQAAQINENLAAAAEAFNIPMGVGSQRLALDNKHFASIFQLKNKFPNLFLIGNIGIAQLQSDDFLDRARQAVDMINADALAIHVNILQELVQVEGDRKFARTYDHLAQLRAALKLPIYIKEVGCGIDAYTARRLDQLGFDAIDVGGAGGTSWTKIEGLRASDAFTRRLAAVFSDFGKSTVACLRDLKNCNLGTKIIATGGLRSGIDVAKAIGLGADFCGVGLPLFKAALQSQNAVEDELHFFAESLRIAMMGSGARDLTQIAPTLSDQGDGCQ